MKYISKHVEIEARRWNPVAGAECLHAEAERIVAWVSANGGKAKFVPVMRDEHGSLETFDTPRIAVRTINGWAYAAPGHFVVVGSAVFRPGPGLPGLRDFYPCDPETFEKRWEPAP